MKKYIIDTYTNDENIMKFPVFGALEAAKTYLEMYVEENGKDIKDYVIVEYIP